MENFKLLKIILILFLIIVNNDFVAQNIDLKNASVKKIAMGFQFVEGPVWFNGALLFSDIPANKIYKWTKDTGVNIFLEPSGNSNGLSVDNNGNLLIAQHGKRRVAKLNADRSESVLIDEFEGKKLNSPNDIDIKSDGSIFFTDPPYGIQKEQEELGFSGIYKLSPTGTIQLLDKSLRRPNGIALSPDETKLYVSDTEEKKIYVWDIVSDTEIANKKLFAFMNIEGNGADGMKIDSKGRLFATGPRGIWVFDEDGTVIDIFDIPGQTTNCNWGGIDGNTLYVTSGDAVYSLSDLNSQ